MAKEMIPLDEPAPTKEPEIVLAGQGEPFVQPVPPPPLPTEAQHAWMKNNPQHSRLSHVRMHRFHTRGTLTPDGSFVPESPQNPVLDGNGHISVGIAHR